jgi:hypothetical protein
MASNKIVFWALDYSNRSGEGKLGRLFISKLKENKKTNKIVLIKSLFTKKGNNINKVFFSSWVHKYFGPIYGVIKLWIFFFQGWRVCYLNYLPLWNFLIFLFLPPNVILGPITGTISRQNKFFLKNKLEQISIIIIKIRYKNVIFSNNFYQNIFKKSYHNFLLANFGLVKSGKIRKYDFVFYIRNELYKKNKFFHNLIKSLLKQKFKIVTIGDKIKMDKIINFGYCDTQKVNTIISLSKYAIGNKENLYSFFVQDCLKHNLTVFYNKEFIDFEIFKFKNFCPIVFDNYKIALKQIIKKTKIKTRTNHFIKVNFDNYFKNLI